MNSHSFREKNMKWWTTLVNAIKNSKEIAKVQEIIANGLRVMNTRLVNTINKINHSKEVAKAKEITTKGSTFINNWIYPVLETSATYTANTTVYLLKYGIAARKAIPNLKLPQTERTRQAAAAFTFKLLPVVGVYIGNTLIHYLIYNEQEKTWTQEGLNSASNFIDTEAKIYTLREFLELGIELFAIMSMAPIDFIEHKKNLLALPDNPCSQCTAQRRFKGSLREPLILLGNDVLAYSVKDIPYLRTILSLFFYGDYINRAVNLHCERHRTTHSEMLLALGIPYVITSLLMDAYLPSTPFLIERALKHLVLLWYINIAAHLRIPYVELGKGTLKFDPIVLYEKFNGFIIDIFFAGVRQLVTPQPNKPPLVSVSWILKTAIGGLNSDLEKVVSPPQNILEKTIQIILPPMFRSTKNMVHDPVLRLYWRNLQEFLFDIIGHLIQMDSSIGRINDSNIPLVATAVKKALPKVLYTYYSFPKEATKVFLGLCEEKEFHSFLQALQQWLDRHKLREQAGLAPLDPSIVSNLFENTASTLVPKNVVPVMEVKPENFKPKAILGTSNNFFQEKKEKEVNFNWGDIQSIVPKGNVSL
jgi:hypothetical protein